MSVLVAVRGWRVSVVNASTRPIRWSHRNEHIYRLARPIQLRAISTAIDRVASPESSTPAEEKKLSQSHGPTKNAQNDLLDTAEPEQSTKNLTAEEKQTVARMRKDNFSKVRIAEFLGRHIQVVHDTLHQLGSINPKRSTNAKFELSDSEWDGIEELRQAGISWNAIRLRMSIDVGPSPLALTFARRMKANNKPVPTTRKPPLVMSSTDLKDIADLRKAGN